jgi:hypothetical protein
MKDVLKISLAQDYFAVVGKYIDWNKTGFIELISLEQLNVIEKILSCEVSIKLMRHANNCYVDGSLIDSMVSIRRKFIEEYEEKYERYIEYNDYY